MRAVVQRVTRAARRPRAARSAPASASCSASPPATTPDAAARLAGKIARLRIFADDEGRFDRSLLDTGGAALVVSQFTLLADTAKGNRPSFTRRRRAGGRRAALRAVLRRRCAALGVPVETGVFGARMAVELVNDGPVTIILERSRLETRTRLVAAEVGTREAGAETAADSGIPPGSSATTTPRRRRIPAPRPRF